MRKERFEKYVKVCERAEAIGSAQYKNRMRSMMDIESADCKFKLQLDELLNASDSEFAHDFCGIVNNIKTRESFPASDFGLFNPRFSLL